MSSSGAATVSRSSVSGTGGHPYPSPSDRLDTVRISIFDCQTTGSSPEKGCLLEIAWTILTGVDGGSPVHSFLVSLPPGHSIPPRISKITGIRDEMMLNPISPGELARLIAPVLESSIPMAHFALFEQRWIHRLMEEHLSDFEVPRFICTREIARRLYPRVPRKGIRALSGFFGHSMGEQRRAADHVAATLLIWRRLLKDLSDQGTVTLELLDDFLSGPVAGNTGPYRYRLSREKRLSLPEDPGIYRFLAGDGSVLYAGKASSLRRRVNSYFTRRKGDEKTLELVSQIHDVEVEKCSTPLEAAMLEFRRIRELDPPYNRALRERDYGMEFMSADLERTSPSPSGEFPWGPVPEWSPALLTGTLMEHLRSGDAPTAESIGLEYLPPEPGAMESGFARFRDTHFSSGDASAIDILITGRELLMDMREEDREQEDECVREPVESMDAHGVYRHLCSTVAGASRDLRRSSWFCLLGWSGIIWLSPSGRRRFVMLSGGRVTDSGWLENGRPQVSGAGTMRERQRAFESVTYDRMRVLDSEVRRLVSRDLMDEVLLPGGPVLDAEKLRYLYSMM